MGYETQVLNAFAHLFQHRGFLYAVDEEQLYELSLGGELGVLGQMESALGEVFGAPWWPCRAFLFPFSLSHFQVVGGP